MLNRAARSRFQQGMTLLEVMIVLAIIALLMYAVGSGFRRVTKQDLADDARDLGFVIRRAQQLAMETGQMHRIWFDLDKHGYHVEACIGAPSLVRASKQRIALSPAEKANRLQAEREKLLTLAPDAISASAADAEARAAALAGHHMAERTCQPAQDGPMDARGRGLVRGLHANIAFKSIAVQHEDDPVVRGAVTLNLFANGAAEKGVIELTDGDVAYAVVVHGLTGRIEVTDTPPSVSDHLRRLGTGAQEAER